MPLLYESLSCVIREAAEDIPHPTFQKVISHPHLLSNTKELWVRKALRSSLGDGAASHSEEEIEQNRQHDVEHLRKAVAGMHHLERIE